MAMQNASVREVLMKMCPWACRGMQHDSDNHFYAFP